jgi:hypothetical protein
LVRRLINISAMIARSFANAISVCTMMRLPDSVGPDERAIFGFAGAHASAQTYSELNHIDWLAVDPRESAASF